MLTASPIADAGRDALADGAHEVEFDGVFMFTLPGFPPSEERHGHGMLDVAQRAATRML
jgi:hypothetical protein